MPAARFGCPDMPAPHSSRQSGFTLVEVLIALTIASVALAAFLRVSSQTTHNYGLIEQRTLAMMSAENTLAESRLRSLLLPEATLVDCPQAEQKFVCRVRSDPPQQGLRTVTVEVYISRSDPSSLLSLQTRLPDAAP